MAPKDSAVAVRLENFISLPIELILRQLLETLESEKEQMRLIDFARRWVGGCAGAGAGLTGADRRWRRGSLEALYRVRLAERTQPLRRSFDLFMANAHTHALTAAVAETTEEDCFLERLHETLVKGNFMLLDDKSYRDAMAAGRCPRAPAGVTRPHCPLFPLPSFPAAAIRVRAEPRSGAQARAAGQRAHPPAARQPRRRARLCPRRARHQRRAR